MRRREFLTLVGGAVLATPVAARAQKAAAPVVGFLCSGSASGDAHRIASVQQGLKEAGYVDGRNLKIEYRWAEHQYDRLTTLASELAALPVAVIVGIGTTPAVVAAKRVTSVIPIVFVIGGDPVELGLVASLNRPGGNLTGVSFLNRAIVAKQFEILNMAVPNGAVTGYLVNPGNPFADADISDAERAANSLQRQILLAKASTSDEIDAAFAKWVKEGIGSALVAGDLFLNAKMEQIVRLASRYSIPTLYPWREATILGGLMSYGADIQDAFRLGGVLAGKILGGENPAELPVELATKIQLVLNLKTAKALAVNFPLALLGRADEVIE
jgi:putative tryptophan/tyrosine transport system substrate-binding protein